jgi:tRNA pseudouridine55 synthase
VTGFVVPIMKEETWTSHDAVHRLRTILGVKEIGHAGSLDPFATGVLVCGVGRGTKIISYLMDLPKEYVGTIRLGIVTDTGDITGEIRERRGLGDLREERIREAAARFVGEIEQIPPMVSAIKVQGRRLYDLAREGIEIERKPRRVTIHSFELTEIAGDRLEFRVRCSKGTYLRALARDLGEALGTGGCVERLCRSAVGSFTLEQAVSLTGDPQQVQDACLEAAVPLVVAIGHLKALRLQSEWVRRVRRGEQPPWRAVDAESLPPEAPLRLVGPEGDLVAIAVLDPVPGPIDRSWRDSWDLKLERVL